MSLLQVENLSATYGVSQVLFGVDLHVESGEVVALMGRNGMGKTTTIKAICRMVASAGTLRFGGQDLHQLASFQVARAGVGLVPEGRRCFGGLTATENLTAAARSGHWTLSRVHDLFPRLAERGDQRAGSLSGGEQQMVAIGRALMTNPACLILDEATEGLAPLIRQEIWSAIRMLKAETQMAILLVDKSMRELSAIADRAVIVERGRTVWQGAMNTLDPDVTQKYVGV